MDDDEPLPAEIKRFILTSIDSVTHLEALLLIRHDPNCEWDASMIAQKLFLSEKKAADLLLNLYESGFIAPCTSKPSFFQYLPRSSELEEMTSRLSKDYGKYLIEITNLIHSKIDKQAQQLGDAFKW